MLNYNVAQWYKRQLMDDLRAMGHVSVVNITVNTINYSLSLCVCVCMYVCVCVCMYVCMYVYIYIHTRSNLGLIEAPGLIECWDPPLRMFAPSSPPTCLKTKTKHFEDGGAANTSPYVNQALYVCVCVCICMCMYVYVYVYVYI